MCWQASSHMHAQALQYFTGLMSMRLMLSADRALNVDDGVMHTQPPEGIPVSCCHKNSCMIVSLAG